MGWELLALVLAHLVAAALLPVVSVRSTRAAFGLAALLPGAALLWALARSGDALGAGAASTVAWAPSLGLTLSFRLDALALAMVVLVYGVGALVLVYGVGYFEPALRRRRARPRCCWPSRARCSAWSWPTTCSPSTSSGS